MAEEAAQAAKIVVAADVDPQQPIGNPSDPTTLNPDSENNAGSLPNDTQIAAPITQSKDNSVFGEAGQRSGTLGQMPSSSLSVTEPKNNQNQTAVADISQAHGTIYADQKVNNDLTPKEPYQFNSQIVPSPMDHAVGFPDTQSPPEQDHQNLVNHGNVVPVNVTTTVTYKNPTVDGKRDSLGQGSSTMMQSSAVSGSRMVGLGSQRSTSKQQQQVQSMGATGRAFNQNKGQVANNGIRPGAQTQNQLIQQRTQPRKQEPGLGIGPGGSDLSHFFNSSQGTRPGKGPTTGQQNPQQAPKPLTAGNFGTLVMDPNEFGPMIQSDAKESRVSSNHGPSIMNIGMLNTGSLYQNQQLHVSNMQSSMPGTTAFSKTNITNTRMVKGPGSFSNNRSKSLNQHSKRSYPQRGGQNQMLVSGEYNTSSNGMMNGSFSGPGFSQMKPFVQGSSLKKPGTQQMSTRAKTLGGNQVKTNDGKKNQTGKFTDYNNFNQKLNQNGIPKNQEIKYRKEMQQLKFYQTLNNYPYIVEQQKLKRQQQLAHQQRISQSSKASVPFQNNAQTSTNELPARISHSRQMNQDDPTNQSMGQNALRESQVTGDRSTKHTVYQMHSSRTKLHPDGMINSGAFEPKPPSVLATQFTNQRNQNNRITPNDTLNNLNVTNSLQDLQKQQHITADVRQNDSKLSNIVCQDESSPDKRVLGGQRSQTQTMMAPTSKSMPQEDRPVADDTTPERSSMPNAGKPSVITQDTDLQISTYNERQSFEQRAIFDQSPKIHQNQNPHNHQEQQQQNSSLDQKTTLRVHQQSSVVGGNDSKLDAHLESAGQMELTKPGLLQTKKFSTHHDQGPPQSSSLNRNNTTSAKPLQNTATATTAILPSQQNMSGTDQFGKKTTDMLPTQPVEKIEIKQHLGSEPQSLPNERKPSKFATQAQSREKLVKQHSEGQSSIMMVQGNQMKHERESKKEIARVQSQKPIVEPLINQQEDAKTLYWRLNSAMQDREADATNVADGTTVLIDKTGRQVLNADISHESQLHVTASRQAKNQSELPPYSNNTTALKNNNVATEKLTGSKNSFGNARPSLGMTNNVGPFDEQVNGVNVEGLFSVWAPNSQQLKLRQKQQKNQVAPPSQHAGLGDPNTVYGGDTTYAKQYQPRSSNTADVSKRTGQRASIGFGLDGVEPSNMAHHMQLVNSIINDGSLHNLVFSNGSLNTEYLQQNKSQVAKLISGSHKKENNDYDEEDYDGIDDEDEDDDEHIIVTMLKSMNSKKLETYQLKDMKLEIDIEKIRTEIKLEYFKELQKKFDNKVEAEWRHRLVKFDRLFNQIIAKKLKLDQENALVLKMEAQAKINEERMKNPFYMTLKAQKEERDKFIDFYQTGVLLGLPPVSESGKLMAPASSDPADSYGNNELEQYQQIESDQQQATTSPREPEDVGDLFKHTGVDIAYEPATGSRNKDDGSNTVFSSNKHKPAISSSQDSRMASLSGKDPINRFDEIEVQSTLSRRENLFCFYHLQTTIPKAFYDKLGNTKVVTSDAISLIEMFIRSEWQVLAKRRRMTFRVSHDSTENLLNTVILGKQAPLSKCCMRTLIFVFPSRANESGRVDCSEPFCTKKTIDTFNMPESLVHSLFIRGIRPTAENQALLPQQEKGGSSYMEQRRKMQTSEGTRGASYHHKLSQRYQSAASYEISKRIGAGNYKHCKLEQAITNQDFQKQHLSSGKLYETDDLMDLILNVNSTTQQAKHQGRDRDLQNSANQHQMSSINSASIGYGYPQSRHQAKNSLYNENQMLAELIQKQALAKSKHKATLPVSKLLKKVPKTQVPSANAYDTPQLEHLQQQFTNTFAGRVHQQGKSFGSQNQALLETGGVLASDRNNVQMLDSMFQASKDQNPLMMMPKLDNILYQDNASSVQHQDTEGNQLVNADIPDADNQIDEQRRLSGLMAEINVEQPDREEISQMMANTQLLPEATPNRNLSSLIDVKARNSQEYNIQETTASKPAYLITTVQEAQDSASVGQTMMTAGGLDDAKYSHSKSPIAITGVLTRDSNVSPSHTSVKGVGFKKTSNLKLKSPQKSLPTKQ